MKPHPRYKPGDRIGGRYQVHKALLGGMGEVYLCLDLEENYPYALKTFQQRYLTDKQGLRTAFEREVATWVALEKHPNIVRCFYMTTLDNQSFMVLEWIAGEKGKGADLRSWLRHGPLELKLALEIVIDICHGLMHAQAKRPGLVHRDLKPENILMAEGGLAKITDFGLAQIVQAAEINIETNATASDRWRSFVGGIAGTPAYMAPEQWRGEMLDERTDIYALGVILYELLVGKPPFQVELAPDILNNFHAWLHAIQAAHEQVHPPKLPNTLPPAINQLLYSCLAKTQLHRPSSLAELLSRLTVFYQQNFGQLPPLRPDAGMFTATDYNNRGATYDDLQQYQAALDDYNCAIKLDPSLAQVYSNRGSTYGALQQYQAALDDFQKAIELAPNLAQGYHNRGKLYDVLQQHQAALDDFTHAIQLDPKFAHAYYSRGIMLAALQQHQAALNDFTHTIQLSPNFVQAYYNRGVTYLALQLPQAAMDDFHRSIQLDSNFARAYLNIGAVLGNQGMHQEALAYFEKAAQLGLEEGFYYVAHARKKLGLEPVVHIDPGERALVAFQQADSEEAIRHAVERFPILLQTDFITEIQQAIIEQVTLEDRPIFEQRLDWLRQIADQYNSE